MNLVNAIPATCLTIAMLAACGGGAQAPQTDEDSLLIRSLSAADYLEKIHGGWLGEAVGSALGMSVQRMHKQNLKPFLTDLGQWPLTDYITSVALEVVDNKGLKNMVVFFSVASFGKSFVINDFVFPLRAIRTGESVGSQGSTCTLDPAAVARGEEFLDPDLLGRIPESASGAERGRLRSGLEQQHPPPRPIRRGWQPSFRKQLMERDLFERHHGHGPYHAVR